ncbi:hypothetical protein GCM10029992_57000 [Glycomyces albus]
MRWCSTRAAVDLTAAEPFPGEQRLQNLSRKALPDGEPTDWPLIGGSDLSGLVADFHSRSGSQARASRTTTWSKSPRSA